MTVAATERPHPLWQSPLLMVLLLGGAFVLIDGLFRNQLFEQAIWSPQELEWFIWPPQGVNALIAILLLGGFGGSVLARVSLMWRQWAVGIASLYAAATVGLGPLAGVVLMLAAAWCVGDWLVERIGLGTSPIGNRDTAVGNALRAALGLACCVTLMQALACWPVNYSMVYLALFAGIIVARHGSLLALGHLLVSPATVNGKGTAAAAGALVFTALLHLVVAAKPEVGHDALSLHLLVPAYVADHSAWHFDITRSVVSLMPMGADWLYTLAYLVGGQYAARFANLACLGLTVVLLYGLLLPRVGQFAARILVAVFLSTPLLGLESGSLFVENFWMLMLFSAAAVSQNEGNYRSRWLAVCLLLAMAMATKVMTVFVLPVFLVFAVWQTRLENVSRREVLISFVSGLALLVVIGGWPYWLALWKTGNPVFPFMNQVFKSPFFDGTKPFDNPDFTQRLSASILYDFTFYTNRYLEAQPGGAGFQWILLLPASFAAMLFARGARMAWGWLLGIVLFVSVFLQFAYLRYAVPTTAFLTLGMAPLFSAVTAGIAVRRQALVLAVGVLGLNTWFFAASGWYHKGLFEPDHFHYVLGAAPERALVAQLNRVDPHARTLFIDNFFAAGLKGVAFGDNWYFPRLKEEFVRVRSRKNFIDNFFAMHLQNNDLGNKWHLFGPKAEPAGASSEEAFISVLHRHSIDYVIGRRKMLSRYGVIAGTPESSFDLVNEAGGAVLLRLRYGAGFSKELLQNGDFSGGVAHWQMVGGVVFQPGSVRVTLRDNLLQAVAVSPGELYKVSLRAVCQAPAMVRLQVNWHDSAGNFLGTFLKPRPCNGGAEFIEVAEAPAQAASAFYYVGAQDERPVDVVNVSLMR